MCIQLGFGFTLFTWSLSDSVPVVKWVLSDYLTKSVVLLIVGTLVLDSYAWVPVFRKSQG